MFLLPKNILAGALLAAASASVLAEAPGVNPSPVPPVPGAATVPAAPAAAPAPANEASRAEDDTFLLLREAARQNDSARANALASRLPNYVLAPYVDYYRLKPRLREAGADEIRAVLQRHQGTAVADRLRTDWLLELGRARDWNNFD